MFDNIAIGGNVIYFDIIINGTTYAWSYTTAFIDGDILQFLEGKQDIIIDEIAEKEAIWANSPHTRTIKDQEGNDIVVDIDKSEIVSPTFPSKSLRIANLVKKTEAFIEFRLPQWRLNRWRAYYDLSKKSESLDTLEQVEYDSFPDASETHEICQQYVAIGLSWCINCILAHKAAILAVQQATTIDELVAAEVIVYPTWTIN